MFRRTRLKVVLGYAIAIAALVIVSMKLGVSWNEVRDAAGRVAWPTLAGSLLLFLLHGVMNAFAYALLLRACDSPLPLRIGASAWSASVLSKYVPGSVWHVVARGVLLQHHGVGVRLVAATGVVEQAIALLVSGVFAAVFLAAAGLIQPAVPIAAVVSALLCLGLLRMIAARMGVALRAGGFAAATALYLAALVPFALGYVMVVSPAAPFAFLGWLFVGTASGMLVFLAPGGLGVREAIVAASVTVESGAVLLVLLLLGRMLILASEIVLSLLAMAGLLSSERRGSTSST